MANNLPQNIYRDMDYDKWDDFLMRVDREKLVDFMLSRMSTDDHFMRLVYEFFNSSDEMATADDLVKAYLNEVEHECTSFVPDVEYIVSLTDRFLQLSVGLSSLYAKVQLLISLIVRLDKAVIIDKIVMEDNDDYILIEDEMKDIDKNLRKVIHTEKDHIAEEEKAEILGIVKSFQQEHTISIMGNEYLEGIRREFES